MSQTVYFGRRPLESSQFRQTHDVRTHFTRHHPSTLQVGIGHINLPLCEATASSSCSNNNRQASGTIMRLLWLVSLLCAGASAFGRSWLFVPLCVH